MAVTRRTNFAGGCGRGLGSGQKTGTPWRCFLYNNLIYMDLWPISRDVINRPKFRPIEESSLL